MEAKKNEQGKKNNITAKIFALIIAIILWSYVMSIETQRFQRNIKT